MVEITMLINIEQSNLCEYNCFRNPTLSVKIVFRLIHFVNPYFGLFIYDNTLYTTLQIFLSLHAKRLTA